MALSVYTGRDITLKINSVAYSDQLSSATLVCNRTDEQYVTFTANTPKAGPATWQLTVRGYQDWTNGTPDGWSRAMWDAAVTGSSVTFELKIETDGTWTGSILPVFPSAGGDANAALETDMTFEVVGTPTLA